MAGPLLTLLREDHARLDVVLDRATSRNGPINIHLFDEFRGGLLRHIAMEEKVLLREARRLRNGEPLGLAKQLHADHAALAALLVPTPTHEIVATIRTVLAEHNPLEEDPGGLYETCEQLVGPGIDEILTRLEAIADVPLARHFDGPRAHENIATLLRARAAARDHS